MSKKVHEGMGGDSLEVESGGVVRVLSGGRIDLATLSALQIAGAENKLPEGVGTGYKIARGVRKQVAAADTVATGLTTVVAVVVSFIQAPTANQAFVTATIGNQTDAPVAGSFISNTWKADYSAADTFSDNLNYAWIAIGT